MDSHTRTHTRSPSALYSIQRTGLILQSCLSQWCSHTSDLTHSDRICGCLRACVFVVWHMVISRHTWVNTPPHTQCHCLIVSVSCQDTRVRANEWCGCHGYPDDAKLLGCNDEVERMRRHKSFDLSILDSVTLPRTIRDLYSLNWSIWSIKTLNV